MAKSLQEYVAWLAGRHDLLWPKPPAVKPMKATASLAPLPGVRVVVWSIYGTLLRIDSGQLLHVHPQDLRMQIALEKTIEEFKMWNSMSRKPGAPWEYMLQQYTRQVDEQRLRATQRKGDVREIDSVAIWEKILDRLQRNEYEYDVSFYGGLADLAEKVAYFFHASLQGVVANGGALAALMSVVGSGRRQGLLDDGQSFTPVQLLAALQAQGPLDSLGQVCQSNYITLSSERQIRKPSPSLCAAAFAPLIHSGLQAEEILYVSHRLLDDLAVAKPFGVRTALYAADANCCHVTAADLKVPGAKPDRLLTDLRQIDQILGG